MVSDCRTCVLKSCSKCDFVLPALCLLNRSAKLPSPHQEISELRFVLLSFFELFFVGVVNVVEYETVSIAAFFVDTPSFSFLVQCFYEHSVKAPCYITVYRGKTPGVKLHCAVNKLSQICSTGPYVYCCWVSLSDWRKPRQKEHWN